MKITDYAILFLTILATFVTVYRLEDRILFERLLYREEVNRTMDNITVSALEKGYIADVHSGIKGGGHLIDDKVVVSMFIKEMSFMLYGADTDISREKVWEHIAAMVIINNDKYIICDKNMGEWTSFAVLSHEGRVRELEEKLNESINGKGFQVMFPANAGEYYSQTIADDAFIVIYVTDSSHDIKEKNGACIVSGAAIK